MQTPDAHTFPQLGAVCGPMIVFAAATGLRPSELFALEERDIDHALGVV